MEPSATRGRVVDSGGLAPWTLFVLSVSCADQHRPADTVDLLDCESCHAGAWDAESLHAERGYSRTCWGCHGQTVWSPAAVHHSRFRLREGPHAGLDCGGCHLDPADPEAITCVSCHEHTRGRTDPRHGGDDYEYSARSCLRCHQTREHRTCESCHIGEIAGREVQPPHEGAMADDCGDCHDQLAWRPARFDHDAWPLTGAHATTSCRGCHADGVFEGTPRLCVECHDGDQEGSRVDHAQLPDADACEECHDTDAWVPAELPDHDSSYPLRGDHRELECAECHTDPTSFAVFTCIDCHEHEQDRMDRKHSECRAEGECRGYEYDSEACFDCHRNGRGDD